MICQHFSQCMREIQAKTVITSKKGKRKKATVYSGHPCGNDSQASKCIASCDNRSILSCSENDKTYSLHIGTHRFPCVCVHIDKGVIDSNACKKCDYAFFIKDEKERVILIELKGEHLSEALEQLKETLRHKEINSAFRNKPVYGRIATSSVPALFTKKWEKLEDEFLRLHGNLKIGRTRFEEAYSDLDRL